MALPSKYFWLRFATSPEQAETDQYLLMDGGAAGTEEEENPLRVKGFFTAEPAWNAARQTFSLRPGLEWGETPWEDWDRNWRERQEPVPVTRELAVCPPWVPSPDFAHVIRLEAKMAFGTGSHESTRIAAELLEYLDLRGKSLLDMGCGTGILALYAARRGAQALGFDIDPLTGPCLAENLELNPPPKPGRAGFFVGDLEALRPGTKFDAVVCNMIRTEVQPFLDALIRILRPGGVLLLSGQRLEERGFWTDWLEKRKANPDCEITMGEWWGFACRPNPSG